MTKRLERAINEMNYHFVNRGIAIQHEISLLENELLYLADRRNQIRENIIAVPLEPYSID